VTLELVGVGDIAPDEAACAFASEYDPDTRTLRLSLDIRPGEGAELRWKQYPAPPALDRAALLHRLLLPVHMSNADKDRMLSIARTVQTPAARLAAYMTFPLPEGLVGALAELECME